MSELLAMDGRIGEAWSGEAPNGSHVNVVIGARGSATGAAIAGALGNPRPGHLPFLVCCGPGVLVRPATVLVNKAPHASAEHERLFYGAVQLGVAQGVLDAVDEGLLPPVLCADLSLLVPVWLDPAATDETAVRLANRAATRAALLNAVHPPDAHRVREVAAGRDGATNDYYRGS